MKRAIIAIAAIAALILPSLSLAATWQIDPAHSEVGFKVRHMMIANVRGEFNTFSGTIEVDETDITTSKINVEIDTNSIDTGIEKRDEHLRSADFFEVAKFPKMTFVSKRVMKLGERKLMVVGDLTMRGVTKEVSLNVDGPTGEIKDPWGNIRRGASAMTTINRKDFGLTWNQVLESSGVAVADEVHITLELELIKVK